MATTRVFTSGHSQAVRLPKEFRVRTKVLEIFRRGDEIILREKPRGMGRAYELIRELPDDLGDLILPDGPPQKRKGL